MGNFCIFIFITSKEQDRLEKNIVYKDGIRPGHDFRYSVNSGKAEKELPWRCNETSLDRALNYTVLYYKYQVFNKQ